MLIRLDDFPTGVRPVLPDLSDMFKILDAFEQSGFYYHVGIVPETLKRFVNDTDKLRLLQYKYLIPTQHGYNHRYDEFAQIMLRNDDLLNKLTVGTFNEFERVPVDRMKVLLQSGKQYLESFFRKTVDTYIPVCNFIDHGLMETLKELNFKAVFVMNAINRDYVFQQIVTDFYGTLESLDNKKYNVYCFHLTWECDYIRLHGFDKWIEMFKEKFA